MAMLPFCGYHMGDYWQHWLNIGKKPGAKLPRIYYVNWFRKGANGKFLWPGYCENSRVLKWIFERCDGKAGVVDTPIGRVPAPGALDLAGLDIPAVDLKELLGVDLDAWTAELPMIQEHYAKFGDGLPQGLREELAGLEDRLGKARK
jgi:phosphoenolpyruvate carboxykinase (GTP)